MNRWGTYPFLRLLIPYIAGIWVAFYLSFPPVQVFVLMFLLFGSMLMPVLFHRFTYAYNYRWIFGAHVFVLIFLAAYLMTACKLERLNSLTRLPDGDIKTGVVMLQVVNPPVEKTRSWRLIGKIVGSPGDTCRLPEGNKILIYLEKSDQIEKIKYADYLLIYGALNPIQSPLNPGEFNYKQYMWDRGIVLQTYIKTGEWEHFQGKNGNLLRLAAYNLSQAYFNLLKTHGMTRQEFAVAAALLLGHDEFLDPEIKQGFSGAGAMHILCVSGLHVGIIYLFFSQIFRFLSRVKHGKIIRALLLIIIIWSYALITGLSPSVMRASTMFTFVAIGRTFNRKTNIYNTLAASAFLLLVIDPIMIREVGFQLSYLAVFFIVSIQPWLYKLWVPDGWILDKAWAIMTVSLAAQLGTFPLSLLYFHQFPNYFLLTNLAVIPLSFLIVVQGMIIAIFSWWPWLSALLVEILGGLISVLNLTVATIENVPGSVSQNIPFTLIQAMMVYLFLLLLCRLVIQRKIIMLRWLLICLFCWFTYGLVGHYSKLNRNEWMVYNVRGHTALGFVSQGQFCILADSALLADTARMKYNILPSHVDAGYSKAMTYRLDEPVIKHTTMLKHREILWFCSKRYFLYGKKDKLTLKSIPRDVDCLIVAAYPGSEWPDMLEKTQPKLVVFSPAVPPWKLGAMKDKLDLMGIAYHDVSASGYYREMIE